MPHARSLTGYLSGIGRLVVWAGGGEAVDVVGREKEWERTRSCRAAISTSARHPRPKKGDGADAVSGLRETPWPCRRRSGGFFTVTHARAQCSRVAIARCHIVLDSNAPSLHTAGRRRGCCSCTLYFVAIVPLRVETPAGTRSVNKKACASVEP